MMLESAKNPNRRQKALRATSVAGLVLSLAGCTLPAVVPVPIPVPVGRTVTAQPEIYPANYDAAALAGKANRELRTLVFGGINVAGICRRIGQDYDSGDPSVLPSKDWLIADTDNLTKRIGRNGLLRVGFRRQNGKTNTNECTGTVEAYSFRRNVDRDRIWRNPDGKYPFRSGGVSAVTIDLTTDNNWVSIENRRRLESLTAGNSLQEYYQLDYRVPDSSKPNDRTNQISCGEYWIVSRATNFTNSLLPDPSIDAKDPYEQGIRC